MDVDPRLEEIDDSLYRVAVRALIVTDNKLLAVKEVDSDDWWAIPGGGVDYGESLKDCLFREIKEEIGVPSASVSSDFQIIHYNIGKVVNGVPRMNIFFKVSVPQDEITKTDHIEKWGWFTEDEFMELGMNPSYDKAELARVIFKWQNNI
ncbi:MAG TPA: NUDIX hydrolase [Candidatus Saccharimonadales bacterium]|nr:NUDIX hydrolase [Candidatus Saccharimonadales bacterium]